MHNVPARFASLGNGISPAGGGPTRWKSDENVLANTNSSNNNVSSNRAVDSETGTTEEDDEDEEEEENAEEGREFGRRRRRRRKSGTWVSRGQAWQKPDKNTVELRCT